jgi:signal recognition particle subunit SRP68
LARCYASIKKYAEALTLTQRANIYIRETRSAMSMVPSVANIPSLSFYSLPVSEVDELESTLSADASRFKNDWLTYNGGSIDADPKTFKKPLFYDIAFNYVKLDMDKLLQRAGKLPLTVPTPLEKKPLAKAKVEEEARPATPEPSKAAPARGGLSSLLGGWWGKS